MGDETGPAPPAEPEGRPRRRRGCLLGVIVMAGLAALVTLLALLT